MSVPIALSGQPVMVKPSEAEKNLVQSTSAASGGLLGPYSGGARRLYVGNLPLTIKEEQLRQVFEPFGEIELVDMPSDPETGNGKGYAFVQFARLEDAKAARNLNGQLEIAGRVIKVSGITDYSGMQEAVGVNLDDDEAVGVNLADLDDDEGNELPQAHLMEKVDCTGTASRYSEFYDPISVPMAIALSGQPVMVKPSEAEKNLVQSTSAAGGGLLGPYAGGARRLYVGNLPLTIKAEQLRQVFEPFGEIELVDMPSDPETGNGKGYAFVQFARLEDAKAARNLNGQLEIAGRVIKVFGITDYAGMQEAVGVNLADLDDDEAVGVNLADLDDDEGNELSRSLLMLKVDWTGTASSSTGALAASVPGQNSDQVLQGLSAADFSMPAVAVPGIDPISVPSECLLLKNIFDPSLEAEPDFDIDIKEDVQDECSKFGKLKHIHVEKNSAGFVYLRFENAQAAMAAQNALHGRWFAGKMISATFMVRGDYEAKFPESS